MISSIARRRTFADLRRGGRRARAGSVRLTFLPLDVDHPQVAFAIGRSFGNAVERNRGRRRLRAAFIEAARSVVTASDRQSTNRSTTGSTHAVDNLLIVAGTDRDVAAGGSASTVNELTDTHRVSPLGVPGELRGAFLLSGNRGLLTTAYSELVGDVTRCLQQLRSAEVQ